MLRVDERQSLHASNEGPQQNKTEEQEHKGDPVHRPLGKQTPRGRRRPAARQQSGSGPGVDQRALGVALGCEPDAPPRPDSPPDR